MLHEAPDRVVCRRWRWQERGAEVCVTVHVVKCKYCLGSGETMMHAAARYKSDWLQIWGANPHIVTPDAVLYRQDRQAGRQTDRQTSIDR